MKKSLFNECKKCCGTGKVQFKHVMGGVCFHCNGLGKVRKTKRVTTLKTIYHVIDFRGHSTPMYEDKAGAEALHAVYVEANCAGEIVAKEVKSYSYVPRYE